MRENEKDAWVGGQAGEGMLDVSIRPGVVRFSTGKEATVGFARGEKRERNPPPPLPLPLPAACGALREELLLLLRGWCVRKRDVERPLFEPLLVLVPSAFCPGTHERKFTLVLPRGVVIFFRMRRFDWDDRVRISRSN